MSATIASSRQCDCRCPLRLTCWRAQEEGQPSVRQVAGRSPLRRIVSVPKLLTIKELSELLSVSVATIYRWNYTGTGPTPIRVGRHVRYRADDVTIWLEQQTVPAK